MKHLENIAPIGAVLGAFSAVICCLPLGIAAGAGAAGLGVIVQPLRPWLMGVSVALLAAGFVQLYRSRAACRRPSAAHTAVLAIAAVIVVALLLFPQAAAAVLADLIPSGPR
jgi:uncharacterized membrane protein YidH (DUF202 family)